MIIIKEDMMNFKKLWRLLFLLSFLFCSCVDKDGDWESMDWRVENLSPQDITYNKRSHEIKVKPNGGSINIICQNYPGFWFDMPFENSEPSFKDYTGEWYDLSIRNNVMMCKFKDSGSEAVNDTLNVIVTAGDIFSYFTFIRTSL